MTKSRKNTKKNYLCVNHLFRLKERGKKDVDVSF